jgi:signal transduction histidine kinase
LESIAKIEKRLVKMIESGDLDPNDNHIPVEFRATPFLTAFYELLEHLDTIETRHLEFLAKVAHDIRSPVATILGYAELLTDSSLRTDENFIETAFSIIRKQGNRVCRLVEEAVMAAEIDAGRIPLQHTEVELDEFLSFLSEDARKQYQRQICFENNAGKVKILADALSLREVILNLVDNAVKYSDPEKEILISLEHSDQKDGIEIRVKDFGIGIPDEDKILLFRRFGRIQKDGHKEKQGAGLGLYLSQRIVQKHAGRIAVESQPGAGSTFIVWLPVENNLSINQSN